MPRQLMRIARVQVVVVASSPVLREALATWLRAAKRVRVVRTAASARDLDGTSLEVVPVRDLREAIARSGIADQ